MELKAALKYMNDQIAVLEKQLFYFETVARPRYEQDVKILADLKRQAVKIDALRQKAADGGEITADEVYDSVPEVFR